MLHEFHTTPSNRAEGMTERSVDADRVCALMSSWRPDEALQIETVDRFPILEISPDASDYLAQSGHLSARDLRFLVTEFAFPVDFRDASAVYGEILQRAQDAPWIFPVLEVLVGDNRSGQRGGKAHGKLSHVLSKLPLMKLRLKSHSDLHARLFELNHSPTSADLAVASFCEYAIASYENRVQVDGLKFVTESAIELLKRALEPHDLRSPPMENGDHEALALLAYRASSEFQVSTALKQQVVDALQRLVSDLDAAAEADSFTVIAELANLGREIAEVLPAQRDEALLDHLQALEVPYATDTLSDKGLTAFAELLVLGLTDDLDRMASVGQALEQQVLELREKINVATQQDDFVTVGILAPQARTAKTDLANQTASRQRVIELLALIVSNRCDDVSAVSRELVDLLEQPTEGLAISGARGSDVSPGDALDPPQAYIHPDDKGVQKPRDVAAGTADSVLGEAAADETSDESTALLPLETKSAQPLESTVSFEQTTAHDEQGRSLEQPTKPVSNKALADLLDRDLIGIAADAAEAFEGRGASWILSAVALKAAAASRLARLDYGADTSKFEAIANRAIADDLDDLSSVLVLGALVRPAILSPKLRNSLQGLCRGILGQHLQQATEAIAHLDYAFPPSSDLLAQVFGSQRPPQRQRFVELMEDWRAAFVRKTSRWPFATAFMHEVASDNGLIGSAIAAIKAGDSNALSIARAAIEDLGSASLIEAQSVNFANNTGRSVARLHAKGIDYLYRQFDEPRSLLRGWIAAVEGEKSRDQLSEARIRSTVANLQSRLDRAIQGLVQEESGDLDVLTLGVSAWIRRQLLEAKKALDGADSGSFATLDEAIYAERDLLPAGARDALEGGEDRFERLVEALHDNAVLAPEQALVRACDEAEFDTAYRLADRFKIGAENTIRERISTFTAQWISEIERRQTQLRSIAKVDYKHQDDLSRQIEWCSIALHRLVATGTGEEVHDLADVPRQFAVLDAVVGQIESNIRTDQRTRISEYRNERNAEEAEQLAGALEQLPIEAVEDRIAQLRDGRSAASFDTDLAGLIGEFVPEFLSFAGSSDWPKSYTAFAEQIERPGLLFMDEDRRTAGLAFVKTYREIVSSLAARNLAGAGIKLLFEEINFENVKLHDLRPVGRTAVWQGTLSGVIRSVRNDGLFIPPAFGSQATAGYQLVLAGPGVLPEAIISVVTPERPAIIVMAGVIDQARRQELAERLRSNAIAALLIDEALVTFAATRRNTRLRTIFECGLPYGRVDPYTTDAGALPPEMFFGREEEIRQIMSKTADGCLVYGGRQLGKSALLGHVERTENAPEKDRHVVRRDVKSLGNSEKTSEVWTHLSQMLPDVVQQTSRTADAVSSDIRRWFSLKPHGRIVCMFDEADHFMDADTRADYPELTKLKELMEDSARAFKVVFAGLHNVQRMYRQPNSPLAHLGSPICIGPLNRTEDDKRAAHHLVVYPMRAAGFRFESHEAVEEVLAWANYYPSLVQEYMKGLLATLHGSGSGKAYRLPAGTPLWPIASNTLFAHRGFQHIESRVREKFHLTLNLDPRYALVAFTLGRLNAEGREHEARVVGFRPEELLAEANYFWPRASEASSLPAFGALLEELFDLGILGRVPIPDTTRFRYLLGSRQVASMLGSPDDIYHALEDIERKDPAVAYDRSIHRRRYAPSKTNVEQTYSPLTDLQIERILRREASPIQIVCGLELLGLSKVSTSLARISELGQLPGAPNENLRARSVTTVKELRNLVDAARPGSSFSTLIVFTPQDAKMAGDVISWAERQPAILADHIRLLVILDASDPELRAIATRRHDQTQYLAAWGAEMVRVHLHNVEELRLDTPPLRLAVLAAAGGMPTETIRLVNEMRVADNALEVASNWKPSGQIPPSVLNGSLGRSLGVIELSDDGDAEAFNAILREHAGGDLVDVGPDLLATGLVSNWNKKTGSMRMSALGQWVRRQVGS